VLDSSATPFRRIAIGVKASTLGPGIELAMPVSSKSNVRAGFNVFDFGHTFNSGGIGYNGTLRMRSVETHYDWFPWGHSFHLSPGLMVYNGNKVTANANVPVGQSFTLNNTDYTSAAGDPVNGNGKLTFNKVAPTFLVGWGNLLPRSGRHISVPFEFGFAYVGTPQTTLNFGGSVCSSGAPCGTIASQPAVQTNILGQQQKINNDVSPFRFYPIVSIGFGYKF
jgi:hypothetical protein